MRLNDPRFGEFCLVREMLETPEILAGFDFGASGPTAQVVKEAGRLFLTGEGSSRIFPAKNLIYDALRLGIPLAPCHRGRSAGPRVRPGGFRRVRGQQQRQDQGSDLAVHPAGRAGAPAALRPDGQRGYAAGKSVRPLPHAPLRQGERGGGHEERGRAGPVLPFDPLPLGKPAKRRGAQPGAGRGESEGDARRASSTRSWSRRSPRRRSIYFAGRNNGVAEELTLKTNEITHKKSDYLEGTYAVHGIEEVMNGPARW